MNSAILLSYCFPNNAIVWYDKCQERLPNLTLKTRIDIIRSINYNRSIISVAQQTDMCPKRNLAIINKKSWNRSTNSNLTICYLSDIQNKVKTCIETHALLMSPLSFLDIVVSHLRIKSITVLFYSVNC